MSDRTEFDDLFRDKLEGREFPFQEAAWQDMQRTLGQKKTKGNQGWIALALLLLLGSGAGWMLTSGDAKNKELASAAPVGNTTITSIDDDGEMARDSNPEVHGTATTAVNDRDTAPSTHGREVMNASTLLADVRTGPTAHTSPKERSDRPITSRVDRSTYTAPIAQTTAETRSGAQDHQVQRPVATSMSREVPKSPWLNTVDVDIEPALPPVNDITQNNAAVELRTDDAQMDTEADHIVPASTEAEERNNGSPIAASQQIERLADAPATTTDPVPTAIDPEALAEQHQHDSAPIASSTQYPSKADKEVLKNSSLGTQENIPTEPTLFDTIVHANKAAQDTASALLQTAPPSVLIDPRAPWEISLLGGAFATNTLFSGTRSALWESDVRGTRATSFGAEVMHMGDHVGFGSGIHYSTYGERIDARELSLTETIFRDSNYLVQVDTTILIANGTIELNGMQYYATQQLDTTITALVLGTTSTTTNTIFREARQRTNVLSYLEIPILFDAHLVQGGWSLGLRGGPTIGMLQGRRGSLPNATMDGYVELEDEAFRELIIGYTARGYIRYRFSDAWSIGVEPTLRGQLFNGMEGEALTRRSTALGGYFGVHYRLK